MTMHRQHRGFALGMVLVLLLALSAAVASTFIIYKQSAGVSGHMLRQRQNFYVCDGAARLIARAAQVYADGETAPTTAAMKNAVCAAGGSPGGACSTTPLPDFVPSGYSVDEFDVEITATAVDTVLDSGPYTGTSAQVREVKLSVSVLRDGNLEKCQVVQELALATFPLLKHTVFGHDKLYWVPENENLNVYGHVHANDDICLAEGSSVAFAIEQVTSGGSIYNHDYATACGIDQGTHAMGIGDGGGFPGSVHQLRDPGERDARDSGWAAYATTHFNGYAEDSSHGIEPLLLPGLSDAEVQPGKDASNIAVDNTGSMRFMLDPVRSTDSTTVRQGKLACQADLRIINGVWYLASASRSAADPCGGWPGTPIWSDHPGRFTINSGTETEEGELTGNLAVGQYDIRTNESWTTVPQRYSYYQYSSLVDTTAHQLNYTASTRPVVSYGSLVDTGSGLRPGHWLDSSNADDVCGSTTTSGSSDGELVAFNSATCGGGAQAGLLNAARGGFLDPEIGTTSPEDTLGDRVARANVLPMNIDLGALNDALSSAASGEHELGNYFTSGRTFNGILWVGATWTGSLEGFGSTTTFAGGPQIWPWQGDSSNANDSNQPDRSAARQSAAAQPALPYPLCGAVGSPPFTAGLNSTPAPSGTGGSRFQVPNCASYAEAGARPVVVRVFNASDIGDSTDSSDPLRNGLTIATPLPLYVMGDVNTTSDTTSSTATPWVPVLFAADHIRLLSESWSDANAYWNGGTDVIHAGSGTADREVTTPTTYNFSAITGMVPNGAGTWGGGVDNSLLLLEDWDGQQMRWRGALVIGFSPVYARWPHIHQAMDQDWEYAHDPHLDRVSSQPPGAPVFRVSATRAWRR